MDNLTKKSPIPRVIQGMFSPAKASEKKRAVSMNEAAIEAEVGATHHALRLKRLKMLISKSCPTRNAVLEAKAIL